VPRQDADNGAIVDNPKQLSSSSNANELPKPAGIGTAISDPINLGPGTVLSGRFEIGSLLGAGGMGSVYAARDRMTGQEIAIKVLLPELLASRPDVRQRFMAEGLLSRDLSHPNIVRVYDVGECGTHIYLSMERLHGETLRQRLDATRQQRMPLATVEIIVGQLIAALQYANRSIVHRDIKPENIWLSADQDATVKLMDFGIARGVTSPDLTRTGISLGTPYYLAPEQWISAKHVDWRADQYSLGVVLYELLTDRVPMGAFKPLEEIRRDLPKRFARAVMRAMASRPEDRWPSWQEFRAALVVPQRKSTRVAVAGTCIAVLAIAAVGVRMNLSPGLDVGQERAALLQPEALVALPATADALQGALADQPRNPEVVPERQPSGPPPGDKPPPSEVAEQAKLPLLPPVTAQKVAQNDEVSLQLITAGTTQMHNPILQPADQPAAMKKLEDAIAPPAASSAPAARALADLSVFQDKLKDGGAGPIMVVIPAGRFLMGSPVSEAGRSADEGPQHWVTVERFALAQVEVTFDQYDRFLQAQGRKQRPSDMGWGRGTRPVINVSWTDATQYAAWLSEQTGQLYRLPSEAEWEYAARARTTVPMPFSTGPCISTGQANFNDSDAYPGCRRTSRKSLGKPQLVGVTGRADDHPFGLRDMHGNVEEWTADCYHSSYERAPEDGSAWLDQEGGDCKRRVQRGGSYNDRPDGLRSANREGHDRDVVFFTVGFRLARAL
jgi:formylglycine-generating enzyme required for sulfatase activity/serine/threonine protein kinase